MPIRYKLTRVNDNITHNPKPRYLVTPKREKNIDLSRMKKLLSVSGSFTTGDVTGVIDNLCEEVAAWLKEGHTVTIDGLGTFFITAHLVQELEDPSYVPPGAVQIKGIAFRPSPELKKALSDAKFERVTK